MENYIVCEKRANQSRIHVKICQYRCENAETCHAFQDYINTHPADKMVTSAEAVSLPQGPMAPRKAA